MTYSAPLTRARLGTGMLCTLLALLLVLASPAKVLAQDEGGGGGDAAASGAGGDAGGDEKKDERGMLRHMIESVGWVFGPLLIFVSITLIAIIVLLAMDLRMAGAIPPGFVEDFTDVVNKRQFKAAYELARNDGSFLGRVMTTGMSRLQYGIEDAREAMFHMVETVKASKDSWISYLATVGTLGPMLGLVGTVSGMIGAFRKLGASKGAPDATSLAGEISHALVVTLVGVGISVPAIFFYTLFKNRLTAISQSTSNLADDLLTQMYHNSKKAAPVERAAPVAAPAAVPEVIPDNRAPAPQAIRPK